MLEIEIDGKVLSVPAGSTVMDAANSIGTYIPHFCYHKKLSIAANCRMCLVQVEKAPKPVPACATPVTEGMKVFTHSDLAIDAQKGVMEFLLINHPLDCPICDQGGECQLQDLAVGYGKSASRYTEDKRVVTNKDLGPLIATDMTRCIHCSRCVRFTEEIAGRQELGMPGRGEHTEVMPFIAKTVETEISGNVIDLCPVGALTSKPFRYSARNWELSRRKSISPHDGLGTNLIVQVKGQRVMRVLPRENEAINECWLADRDRFSYEALNSANRLTSPMIKYGGEWLSVDWTTALEYVVKSLRQVIFENQGPAAVSALAAPNSTLEELFLLKKLMHGLGVKQIDTRLRQSDFALDQHKHGADWLGQSILELIQNEAVLIVGSTLRKEQPLLTQRLRQAVKKGMALSVVHAAADDLLMALTGELIVRPEQLVEGLGEILLALAEKTGQAIAMHIDLTGVSISATARRIANSLVGKEKTSILLGNVALSHPRASEIRTIAQEIAALTGAKLGVMSMAANTVGAELLGLQAGNLLAGESKAYVLLNIDPVLDGYDAQLAHQTLKAADTVIALTSHHSEDLLHYADVLLPIAPFSETAGTFINMEGLAQSFNGVVRPLGETRPGWKVLRVLGNMFELEGFAYNSPEEVRDAVLEDNYQTRLNTASAPIAVKANFAQHALVRLGEVTVHQLDMLCRNAPSLQQTQDALRANKVQVNRQLLVDLAINEGDLVRVRQGPGEAILPVALDDALPDNVIRVAASNALTRALAGMFDAISIEKV
jgi:NADH-quinone oxidoreductase subunit G